MKILCICTANLQRSVTLEAMLNATPDCEARSAGTCPPPDRTRITEEALRWADRIIVFEAAHVRHIKRKHWTLFPRLRIVNLDIEDDFQAFDEALMALLQTKFRARFGVELGRPDLQKGTA
jgi:predicted protein tyrosine phosphatase